MSTATEASPTEAPLHEGRRDEKFTKRLHDLMQSTIEQASLDKFRKSLKDALDTLAEEHEWWIKDHLACNLAEYVQQMADRSINAMLNGNESELRRYLTCELGYWNGRDRDHPVIHGRLFEQGGIELRKKLVEQHAELLKSERILDLEDQVRSLVEQNNKQAVEINRLREDLR